LTDIASFNASCTLTPYTDWRVRAFSSDVAPVRRKRVETRIQSLCSDPIGTESLKAAPTRLKRFARNLAVSAPLSLQHLRREELTLKHHHASAQCRASSLVKPAMRNASVRCRQRPQDHMQMPVEPPDVPPATPGHPTEPPPESPPGRPDPQIPPPLHEPGEPPRPDELPGRMPDEVPLPGPNGPPPQPSA